MHRTVPIVLGSHVITAEIADSIISKGVGLMGRTEIPEDSGMLFAFKRDVKEIFWTFGMRFPIDIIFFDASKKIVEIREDCLSWRTIIVPKKKFRYALEIAAGSVRRMNARVGDAMAF